VPEALTRSTGLPPAAVPAPAPVLKPVVPSSTSHAGTPPPLDEDDEVELEGALDLPAVADLCAYMTQVQDTKELQGLVERIADVLDATGVIVWVPDSGRGLLRPVLNYGFSALDVMRMGAVQPTADNATATAYRTRSVRVVPAEPSLSGAVVAPLLTPDGCAGVLAVELREGMDVTTEVRAVAAIIAAQLATLLMPVPTPTPAPEPWPDQAPRKP